MSYFVISPCIYKGNPYFIGQQIDGDDDAEMQNLISLGAVNQVTEPAEAADENTLKAGKPAKANKVLTAGENKVLTPVDNK